MEMVSKQKSVMGMVSNVIVVKEIGKRMNNDIAFPHAAQGVPSIVCISLSESVPWART